MTDKPPREGEKENVMSKSKNQFEMPVLEVSLQRRGQVVTPVDVTDVMAVRFTLPDGSWVDVECQLRDGVPGLCVRGSDMLGIKLSSANVFWVLPRDGKV